MNIFFFSSRFAILICNHIHMAQIEVYLPIIIRKRKHLHVHNLFNALQTLVSYRFTCRQIVRLVLVRSAPSLRRKATRSPRNSIPRSDSYEFSWFARIDRSLRGTSPCFPRVHSRTQRARERGVPHSRYTLAPEKLVTVHSISAYALYNMR